MTRHRSGSPLSHFMVVLAGLCVVVAPRTVLAQIDATRFHGALGPEGFLTIDGSRVPSPGRWDVGIGTRWTKGLVETEGFRPTIEQRWLSELQLQLGFLERAAVGLHLPAVLHQNATEAAAEGSGLGDPRLSLRYRVYGKPPSGDSPGQGLGVAFQGVTTLPLGRDQILSGERGVTTDLKTLVDFHLLGAGVGWVFGWRHRFDPQRVGTLNFRDVLSLGLGLKVPLPLDPNLAALVEVRTETDAGSPFSRSSTTPIQGDLGVRWLWQGLSTTFHIGTGFNNGVGAPDLQAGLLLTYRRPIKDVDGDGIADREDACPHLAEDFDGYQDADGCLDPDNDNDWVLDPDDRCPNSPAGDHDIDGDGCPDPIDSEGRARLPLARKARTPRIHLGHMGNQSGRGGTRLAHVLRRSVRARLDQADVPITSRKTRTENILKGGRSRTDNRLEGSVVRYQRRRTRKGLKVRIVVSLVLLDETTRTLRVTAEGMATGQRTLRRYSAEAERELADRTVERAVEGALCPELIARIRRQ